MMMLVMAVMLMAMMLVAMIVATMVMMATMVATMVAAGVVEEPAPASAFVPFGRGKWGCDPRNKPPFHFRPGLPAAPQRERFFGKGSTFWGYNQRTTVRVVTKALSEE